MTPEIEKQVREIIRRTIDETAFDELRKAPSKKESFFDELRKNAQKNAQVAHDALFFGGNKDNLEGTRKRIALGESAKPKINKTDVANFEKEFQNFIPNATISLDTQKNGYALSFPKVPDGVEVYASGKLTFGQGQVVDFKLSLLNGAIVNLLNFKPTQDNKTVIEDLYNFYHTWSDHWRETLGNATAEDETESGGAEEMPAL